MRNKERERGEDRGEARWIEAEEKVAAGGQESEEQPQPEGAEKRGEAEKQAEGQRSSLHLFFLKQSFGQG